MASIVAYMDSAHGLIPVGDSEQRLYALVDLKIGLIDVTPLWQSDFRALCQEAIRGFRYRRQLKNKLLDG
jgi:hypothetical protein